MEEKTYKFDEHKGVNNVITIEVKESELTHAQKQLIVGQFIIDFNNLPEDCITMFMQELMRKFNADRAERRYNKLNHLMDGQQEG